MRKVIFISILLTFCGVTGAQDGKEKKPVRLVFTTNYQNNLFGYDPVWRRWTDGSLSRALTYINAHRQDMGEDRFALVHCGYIPDVYNLYPGNAVESRVYDYAGYLKYPETTSFERQGIIFKGKWIWEDTIFPFSEDAADVTYGVFSSEKATRGQIAKTEGIDLAVMAVGREPEIFKVINIDGDTVTVINTGTTGKYIGVADFTTAKEFTVRTVDISGFPVDAEYEDHFQPLTDSIRAYYDQSLVRVSGPVIQSGFLFGPTAYTGLFHRFQLDVTGADISFFAVPRQEESIPAGDFTFRDVMRRFRYDNWLDVVELTGEEVYRYLEYTYGLRYNTMRRSTDDLLRLTRDRDGVLQTQTAVYNLDDAAGIRYQVDVSKPQGRRIRILSMADGSPFDRAGRYRVAMNSHRLESGYLTRACGLSREQIVERLHWESNEDIRLMLRDWLAKQPEIIPEKPHNWRVVPESFVESDSVL